MKAIIVATLVVLAMVAAVTIAFRTLHRPPGAAVLAKVFLAFVPALVVVWEFTPDDLGFLPRSMLAEPPWFDLTACLFFYTAAFGGGVLQLYNLAERGLSLRILAELDAADGRSMSVDEIAEQYSEGRGLAWMYDKRLDGLVRQHLVAVEGDAVTLTSRGRFWAGRLAYLRRFLRLPSP
jgi:hypothetical protein